MSTYLVGALWVFGAALIAGAVGYLVRRIGQDEGRSSNNDAAGQVFTIVNGLHAVVLAFVLVKLFDVVSDARDGTYREAQALVSVAWAVDALEPGAGQQVRDLGARYARTVIDQEWPVMRIGGEVTGPGWAQLDRIRATVLAAGSQGDWQDGRKTEAADQLGQVYQERQERLTRAFDEGVVAVVWFVLILGSVVCVVLPNLFGGTRLGPHVLLVSTLAGALALMLFAIHQLQNPFSGGSSIDPDAFRWALDRLGRS